MQNPRFAFGVAVILWQALQALAWLEVPHWYNELFGDGDFHEESSQLVAKHLSRLQCCDHNFRQISPIFGNFRQFSANFANFRQISPIFGKKLAK
jgi:hypothetical protein